MVSFSNFVPILISSFQNISQLIRNFLHLKAFKVHICENMQNTLQINEYRKTLSFCQYLHNKNLRCGDDSIAMKIHARKHAHHLNHLHPPSHQPPPPTAGNLTTAISQLLLKNLNNLKKEDDLKVKTTSN